MALIEDRFGQRLGREAVYALAFHGIHWQEFLVCVTILSWDDRRTPYLEAMSEALGCQSRGNEGMDVLELGDAIEAQGKTHF